MRELIENLSIGKKLFLVFLLLFSVTLVWVSLSFFYQTVDQLNQQRYQEYLGSAKLLDLNLLENLTLNEKQKAQQLIAHLKGHPGLVQVMVFDQKLHLFAEYTNQNLAQPKASSPYVMHKKLLWPNNISENLLFDSKYMHLKYPIKHLDKVMGMIYFQVQLLDRDHYEFQSVKLLLGVLGLLGFFVIVLGSWFRFVNLRPIENLSQIIKNIIDKKDFSLRAYQNTSDEIGLLFERFNTLMSDIERRDEALKFHKQRLEMEVESQTNHLKVSNAELESTIQALKDANKTLRVTEEDKRVAEKSAKTKATFLANMSHELRTPMNGVLGMINLLSETKLNTEQMYYVQVALDSGSALLTILNDILDLSKIEHGKLSLEEIEFDVHQIVDEVFSVLGESSYSKDVELVWHFENEVPEYVIGDPVRIRQVIYNVIGNAIKFTDSGFVSMTLAAESFSVQQTQKIKLTFCITDTGVGIKEEALLGIFDSFSQADSSTTRRFGGTGLGLALCKELTDLMGGDIKVESEFGQGSVFTFTVIVRPSQKTNETTELKVKPQSVLVLDDQVVSLKAIHQYLSRLAIPCDTALDATTFLNKLQQKHYELLVIDLSLPDTDPRQLMDQVRQLPDYQSIPIILMGSHDQRTRTNVHYAALTQGHWVKPLRFSVIKHVLNQLGQHMDAKTYQIPNTTPESKKVLLFDSLSADKVSKTNGYRILVVEDNVVNQQVAVSRLKKLGYEVETAENGEKAILKLKEHPFDLVFMDCQMPVLDGFEATRRIRKMDVKFSSMPIIAMTANAMSGDREKCLEAGMNDYLAKPVNAEELDKVLSNWLV